MIRKAKKFIGEVRTELSKATWPWDPKEKGIKKYRELIDSTGIVLVAMLLLGAFVALSDFFLVNAVSAFTRTGIEERVRRPAAIVGGTPSAPAPEDAPSPKASKPVEPATPAESPAPAESAPAPAPAESAPAPAPAEPAPAPAQP